MTAIDKFSTVSCSGLFPRRWGDRLVHNMSLNYIVSLTKGVIIMMISDEYEVRVCITCKQSRSEPAEWWEFVSNSCQPCDLSFLLVEDGPRFNEYGEPF